MRQAGRYVVNQARVVSESGRQGEDGVGGMSSSGGGGGSGSSSSSVRGSSSRSRTEEIGKYRLLKTIGKGNFAKVKLAKHVPTGKEVSTPCDVFFVYVFFCIFFHWCIVLLFYFHTFIHLFCSGVAAKGLRLQRPQQ
ncbi:Serine/threonine-protein kinase par-1 [Portunus trituberculatus]|uniref:Serine/threonine-protein kinase par-1 n=1 Tax=Portunus trituberculatus TaxID=210409 RepID=A0A5B7IWD7_PORTR|nr:Serine/threonine-protein kinase par-1 [Portunus trituberculatus]